jgi:MFS family permease
VSDLLGFGALGMMKERSFAVFILASLLICIPLAGYYAIAAIFINEAGFHSAGGVMIWGQVSEILFMLLIPVLFARLGVKWMLSIGMLAWSVRYVLFATAAPDGIAWMILIGILLHGICYDFFFVTGFIYTDKKAPAAIRGQAQGLLVLVTQGIGLGLGAPIMARIYDQQKAANYRELTDEANQLREQYQEGGGTDEALWERASELMLSATDWKTIWLYPAAMAGVVLVLFFILFNDRVRDQDTTTAETGPSDDAP